MHWRFSGVDCMRATATGSLSRLDAMEQLRELLKQQHRDLNDLASEFQRKEITPARIIRLMKIVQRNVDISERIVSMLEKSKDVGVAASQARSGS